jgi:hypothetical protein
LHSPLQVWFLREGDYATVWKYELNPSEQGMSARAMTLKNINTPQPCETTTFLVIGTATNLGEVLAGHQCLCGYLEPFPSLSLHRTSAEGIMSRVFCRLC